jgi:hypothetical protein
MPPIRPLAALLLLTVSLHAQSVSPTRMKAHIDFLASDLLEGRETGSRGYDVAAQYVAAQLAAAGVAPGGDDGTYLHNVRFNTYKLIAERSSFCIVSGAECKPLVHRKDLTIGAGLEPLRELEAGVVHVGFGIVAPGLNHDDYGDLDVRGKIVAFLAGAPPRFPTTQRAHYSSNEVKREEAVKRGAIGIIGLRTLDIERRMAWSRVVQGQDGTGMRALDKKGMPVDTFPQLRASIAIPPHSAEALFAGARMTAEQILADAEKGVTHSFPLPVRVRVKTATELGALSSPNVVGIVKGSSPKLANEYVVLTAHLDHLAPLANGEDRIRNGALDNASGIAALLEVARAVAKMKPRPLRSIAFVALTGEEKGTQGSLAYADDPRLPGRIVANVNMDMLTMLFPLKSVVALGDQHSSLGPLSKAAAEKAGFVVEADPLPEETRFIRSDQYSFVQKGIPAITYKGGLQSLDPTIDGDKITREWLRNVYHGVNDESDQQIHYASGARWAEANMNLVVAIANGGEPRWNEGDFFGGLYGGANE